MLVEAERLRRSLAPGTPRVEKSRLGQFMTPANIAMFMAGMFKDTPGKDVRLLDPGAGLGALSCAFLDKITEGTPLNRKISVVAYEASIELARYLDPLLGTYSAKNVHTTVCVGDFVEAAANLTALSCRPFTHAILNPPYKKISSNSHHRAELRRAGIETVNLYSGFVALALELLVPGGQLVAILPRSFCNGPYYRPFRNFVLDRAAIRHVHIFESRQKPFHDDAVLQETVIIHLERDASQDSVVVSKSTDGSLFDLTSFDLPFEQIVRPEDDERFIHIPSSTAPSPLSEALDKAGSLVDLGLTVSTGPVVDFRLSALLRQHPGADTAPLLYPGHFSGLTLTWPKMSSRKPNAVVRDDTSMKWMLPNGWYAVVRRFSAKEERRRVIAGVIDPNVLGNADLIGIENHLNVFHTAKHGTSEEIAKGIATYLNTTLVDTHFRRFGGHTQVNATDLKSLVYPSLGKLEDLGRWAMASEVYTQDAIDTAFAGLR